MTTQRSPAPDSTTTSTTTPTSTTSPRQIALGVERLIGAPGDPERISCSWVPASTAATMGLAGQRYAAGFFNDGGYLADDLARTCFHDRDDVPPLQLDVDDAYDSFGATVGVDDRSAALGAVDITVFAVVGQAAHLIASGTDSEFPYRSTRRSRTGPPWSRSTSLRGFRTKRSPSQTRISSVDGGVSCPYAVTSAVASSIDRRPMPEHLAA